MPTAAKEKMFSACSDPCVLFPLAASEGVPKNSRLGFATENVAPHQGSAWSNSGKALGIREVVWENCGGSDDSARYYDAISARFLSEDPIGFDGGANFYTYVKNDSPNYRDPTGLAMCVYHIGQHTMICWPTGIGSVGNNTILTLGPQGVDSGDPGSCRDNPDCIYKHGGPIIPGNYKINPDLRPEHAGWPLFRLEPDPPVSKLDAALIRLNLKRGGFELHIGTRTHGCINAENGDPQAVKQFNAIYQLLQSESNNRLLVLP